MLAPARNHYVQTGLNLAQIFIQRAAQVGEAGVVSGLK
jgi:hypothetical protein